MRRTHRISAGAIVLDQGKVLLVRYAYGQGGTFLAAPGGGAHMRESLPHAAVREVREETGLVVAAEPCRILCVEELISDYHKHIKVWLLCSLVGGTLTATRAAAKEGIVQAGWYAQEDVTNETVFPPILETTDWQSFLNPIWETRYLAPRKVNF